MVVPRGIYFEYLLFRHVSVLAGGKHYLIKFIFISLAGVIPSSFVQGFTS
jgi:hypothetical protein